jgi:hypothetical protein
MAVNFSDESIFHLFGSDGIEWCWRRPGECLDPQFMKDMVKHSGGNVTVWGMIMAQGVGQIIWIEGNLNKELYCEILEDDVLGSDANGPSQELRAAGLGRFWASQSR